MKILAIDPGPVNSAYVVWDGSVLDHGIVPNEVMRAYFQARLEFIQATHCVIEMIASYGMPVGAEVFETCFWIGKFAESCFRMAGKEPVRIPRGDVKLHLCGTKRAKDPNVRQALIDRLGAPGTKKAPGVTYGIKADEWAALAVAVTAYDRLKCGIDRESGMARRV